VSGIIPPSIVNYDWTVKINDSSFLNVSFPFPVKIESIWFTTQQVYGETYGFWNSTVTDGETVTNNLLDVETTDRVLRLAASKTKNSKTQHANWNNPTDYMYAFEDIGYGDEPNASLKPTMWLGNPDDSDGSIGAFATNSGFYSNGLSLRSNAKTPVDKARAQNSSWSEPEFTARTYLADAAILNTDEFLQMFIYDGGGDWAGYQNDGKVTISVAYTGIHSPEVDSAKPWAAWWND
jgi:hypothetical protein